MTIKVKHKSKLLVETTKGRYLLYSKIVFSTYKWELSKDHFHSPRTPAVAVFYPTRGLACSLERVSERLQPNKV